MTSAASPSPGNGALYEGKSKLVMPGPEPQWRRIRFKDDATAFNGAKKGTIVGKGIINRDLSVALYPWLERNGVPTHHVRAEGERDWIVTAVEIVPVEFVVRNRVAGSLAKRVGRPEGGDLPRPIVELYLKSDELGDPFLNDDHVDVFGLATPAELAEGRRLSLRVNALLSALLAKAGISLVDFKLEFGRSLDPARPGLLLADEFTPDGARLWDAKTGERLDKDRFRRDLGRVEESYAEVASRIHAALAEFGDAVAASV